uniref:Uncharacterized protein n=1 Tax=Leersia perrieri TaxID=77586 RepID=A0A0D9VNI2_9ORYZ
MRSWSVRFMLLLILLGAEVTGICHGRTIPSLKVIMVHDEGDSPSPASKAYVLTAEKAPPGDAGRRMMQDDEGGVYESKRVVPEGPNPLHN